MPPKNLFKKYEESGTAPVLNLLLAFISSLLIISFFSFIYNILLTLSPIVYLNVLLVVGLGYCIAYTVRYLCLAFKIRNQRICFLATGIISLIIIYIQWVLFIYIYLANEINPLQDISIILELFISPDIIFNDIIQINSIGTWEIRSTIINGPILWCVWITEAVILILVPLRIYNLFEVIPFSEIDNKWYKKVKIDQEFEYITLRNHFLESLYSNPSKALMNLSKPDPYRYSNVYIYYDKNRISFLIEIENVSIDKNSKKDYIEVLAPSHIESHHIKEIKENFNLK
ncbi:hypothetical protein AAON49_08505 [Pseudotenacibaculum sp. MALMAid0570]|uniref:hypothetical protein n=1 Tax=Pseudotenacibaculum sp. MALMAid0570 TaxID=3143938 RepID=UPI0032E02C5B